MQLSKKSRREKLRRRAKRLLKSLNLTESEVTIVLCDDAFIAALNSQWRGIPSPTDVLSFPQVSPGEIASFLTGKTAAPPLLGDIVISLETVERRAQKTDFQEIERLFIHGLAHLLGHDHIEDHEA
ncbi:rRNA maturation RNase YbeY, partial [Myxococcota bacterium]|nr:rRNA maturation RNase YbeY [Myxococcota bacterium]